MADPNLWRKNVPADYDGRFGKRFDEELQLPGIGWTVAGIVAACALGFLISWGLYVLFVAQAEAAAPPPSPIAEANERQLPPAPQLQAGPEREYEEMQRELRAHLEGYGWVDEASGVVRIPIDRAIELMLEEPYRMGAEDDPQGPIELEGAPSENTLMRVGAGEEGDG